MRSEVTKGSDKGHANLLAEMAEESAEKNYMKDLYDSHWPSKSEKQLNRRREYFQKVLSIRSFPPFLSRTNPPSKTETI